MKTLKLYAAIIGLSLCFSVVQAADKKDDKRHPNTMPPGALGMPIMPGSGLPPGAVGMPAPMDASCRRAAGMAAVKEALDDNDNVKDCSVSSLTAVKLNLSYTVTVSCAEGENEGESTVYRVKTRLKSKKLNTCRAISTEPLQE